MGRSASERPRRFVLAQQLVGQWLGVKPTRVHVEVSLTIELVDGFEGHKTIGKFGVSWIQHQLGGLNEVGDKLPWVFIADRNTDSRRADAGFLQLCR